MNENNKIIEHNESSEDIAAQPATDTTTYLNIVGIMEVEICMNVLPGGTVTNWRHGSVGYEEEHAFASYILANKQLGYGRMLQMIGDIWCHESKVTAWDHLLDERGLSRD